jgi:hypothetical protein
MSRTRQRMIEIMRASEKLTYINAKFVAASRLKFFLALEHPANEEKSLRNCVTGLQRAHGAVASNRPDTGPVQVT